MNRRINAIAIFLLVFPVIGCGYRFSPGGEGIGRDIKNVYVASFANNTAEANIETTFRNAFIDQIIKGRRFKVVTSEEAADTLLKGDIKNLSLSPLAYRGISLTVEQRINVTLSLVLEEKATKKVLFREENFSQWGDFAADGTAISAGAASQKNALVKLANDAAERAYRMMFADF